MNQNHSKLIKNNTIRIQYRGNYGSGVLINLADKVLFITAAHVLDYGKKFAVDEIIAERLNNNTLETMNLEVLGAIFDSKVDVAILQIGIDYEVAKINLCKPLTGGIAILSGYPVSLSDVADTKWLLLEGKYKDVTFRSSIVTIDEKLETFTQEAKNYIDGFSGGGVFTIAGGKIGFSGIETSVLTPDVAYNAIRCIPIDYIVDIIKTNNESLNIENVLLNKINLCSSGVWSSPYYGMIFLPASDYDTSLSYQTISDQYKEGVDANPVHIRNNLDITRSDRMRVISDYFSKFPIVILRGASGQGKTTLALRFLMNTYAEQNIFIIHNMATEAYLSQFLSFLQSLESTEQFALFYDVVPGDSLWAQFVKEFYNLGINMKLLVAVREEEFNNVALKKHEVPYNDIHLWLAEEEARSLYCSYGSNRYISFENAWKDFGGEGPLLEFTYMLSHSERMYEKIQAQVQRIEEEEDAEIWFLILGIIAIAGKYNVEISTSKLFEKVTCRSKGRLLKRFAEELFIKAEADENSIECLHAIRAELILQALNSEILFDYKKTMNVALSIIDDNTTYMAIDYLVCKGAECNIRNSFDEITYFSLKGLSGVLKAVLWFAIYKYLIVNKEIIEEGNKLVNNQYLLNALTDITGLLATKETGTELLETLHPGNSENVHTLVQKQAVRYLDYSDVKFFILNQAETVSALVQTSKVDGSQLGYILFWAGKFGISLCGNQKIHVQEAGCESYLDLIKGVNEQSGVLEIEEIKRLYFEKILAYAGIVSLQERESEIFANVAIMAKHAVEGSIRFNDICVRAIYVLRILYPDMKIYHVKLIGTQVLELEFPDTEKHILNENLQEKWITELNGIALKLQAFSCANNTWEDVYRDIERYRTAVVECLSEALAVLNKYYEKGRANTNKLSELLREWQYKNPFSLPRCSLDRYGIRNTVVNENNVFMTEDSIGGGNGFFQNSNERNVHDFEGDIKEYSQSINNFIRILPNAMLALADRSVDSNYYRLVYYNISRAFEVLPDMQMKYKLFFQGKLTTLDEEQEYLVVQKATALSSYMYQEHYRQQKNILYYANEQLKKQFRKIDTYLDNGIRKIPGVIQVIKAGKIVTIVVSREDYEDVRHQVFEDVREITDLRLDISAAEAYFKQIVHLIKFVIQKHSKDVYQISISSTNFFITDDYNRFVQYLLLSHEKILCDEETFIWEDLRLPVWIMLNQLLQINKVLIELPEDCLMKQSVDELECKYRKIFAEIRSDIEKNDESNREVLTAIANFENESLVNIPRSKDR